MLLQSLDLLALHWGEAKRNAVNQDVMRNGNPVVVIVFGMTIFPVAAALVMEAPEAVVAPVMEVPEAVVDLVMEVPEAVVALVMEAPEAVALVMEIPEAAAPTMVVPVLAVALVVVNIPEKGKVLRNIPVHRNHQNLISMTPMMMDTKMCMRTKIMTRIGITRIMIMPME